MNLKGRTALITGASGGIGKELALCLMKRGTRVVLTGRSLETLEAVAADAPPSSSKPELVQADLSLPEGPGVLLAELGQRGLQIDMLVNNAGAGCFGEFLETDWSQERAMLQLNIAALTELSKGLAPAMAARGSGAILNVASTAAFFPGPLMACYYATKAYVLSLSEALHEELKPKGIVVTALCPGPTATGFQQGAKMEGSRLTASGMMKADEVAEEGVRGLERGQRVVVPGMRNKLLVFLPRIMPRSMVPRMVRQAQEKV